MIEGHVDLPSVPHPGVTLEFSIRYIHSTCHDRREGVVCLTESHRLKLVILRYLHAPVSGFPRLRNSNGRLSHDDLFLDL